MATLLLIGGGKMGSALARGWIDQGIAPKDITAVEPSVETGRELNQALGIQVITSATELAEDYRPDVAVVAIKPQVMEQVLPPYARLADGTVFVSIAAGKPLAAFEAILGSAAKVVRAMPNTPASIGRGISVACANANVGDPDRRTASGLLQAVGEVAWVEDEAQLDAVTALSGSGPAYIFLLCEAMAHAGVMAGLPVELSNTLARATVAGAGEMLHQLPDTAETLRQNVTSPGGTTAAALDILMAEPGMKDLMVKAIDAATKRSRELAG